jgi:hypothetical protein
LRGNRREQGRPLPCKKQYNKNGGLNMQLARFRYLSIFQEEKIMNMRFGIDFGDSQNNGRKPDDR